MPAPRVGLASFADTNKQKLKFSFEYYDNTCDDYCLSKWESSQVRDALIRLREICAVSFMDMQSQSKQYHFAEVIWERTTKPTGFPFRALDGLPAFHFALLGINHQKARVFGAYQAGVFYIVWFDLNHEIWPSVLKHT